MPEAFIEETHKLQLEVFLVLGHLSLRNGDYYPASTESHGTKEGCLSARIGQVWRLFGLGESDWLRVRGQHVGCVQVFSHESAGSLPSAIIGHDCERAAPPGNSMRLKGSWTGKHLDRRGQIDVAVEANEMVEGHLNFKSFHQEDPRVEVEH